MPVSIENLTISVYPRADRSGGNGQRRTLGEVVKAITGDSLAEVTEEYRGLMREHGKTADVVRDYKAQRFPAMTCAGAIDGPRARGWPARHTGLYQLDIDGVDPAELPGLLAGAAALPYAALVFTSPSRGVKVLVRGPAPEGNDTPAQHRAWKGITNRAAADMGIDWKDSTDPNVKGAVGLLFLCHDPAAYFNPHAEVGDPLPPPEDDRPTAPGGATPMGGAGDGFDDYSIDRSASGFLKCPRSTGDGTARAKWLADVRTRYSLGFDIAEIAEWCATGNARSCGDPAEIESAVKDWPPDPIDEARQALRGQARNAGWRNAAADAQYRAARDAQGNPAAQPDAPRRILPTPEYIAEVDGNLPPALLAVGGKGGALLTEGQVSLVSGEGGAGKSLLIYGLALSFAMESHTASPVALTGAIFDAPTGGGRVLILSYEDHKAKVKGIIEGLADVYRGIGPDLGRRATAATQSGVAIMNMRDFPLFGAGDGEGGRPGFYNQRHAALDGWQALSNAVEAVKPRLIIIDPILSAYNGDSNHPAPVREFVGKLGVMAETHHAGVLLAGHSTKKVRGGDRDLYDAGQIGGSAAWADAARGVLVLNRVEEEDGWVCRKLAVAKSNDGPAFLELELDEVLITLAGGYRKPVGFQAVNNDWQPKPAAPSPPRNKRQARPAIPAGPPPPPEMTRMRESTENDILAKVATGIITTDGLAADTPRPTMQDLAAAFPDRGAAVNGDAEAMDDAQYRIAWLMAVNGRLILDWLIQVLKNIPEFTPPMWSRK